MEIIDLDNEKMKKVIGFIVKFQLPVVITATGSDISFEEPVKIIDLARKMIKLAGFIPDKDIPIKIVGLRPGEKLYEELLNDTSKTIPTYHEKIMIAEEIQEEFENLHLEIEELIGMSTFFSNEDIVGKMKKIVPEFKSMNSAFHFLDS